jgi:murein endopeptidase
MTRCRPFLKSNAVRFSVISLLIFGSTLFDNSVHAMTVSVGEPFRGKLIDGVQFPSQLVACKLHDENRSYTTPEVVGALLDAFKRFGEKYPGSCDVQFGDFSQKGGGRMKGHESHQNGRDVDMGLYAVGNVALQGFVPMDSKILDVPKTWDMIQSLVGTHDVEHIYLDRNIQVRLYQYARSEGMEPEFLSKVFSMAGSGSDRESIIQHVPGHRNHMHIRFFSPWSTLAGTSKGRDPAEKLKIEVAQQACLPKRVSYSTRQNEKDLNQLATLFAVNAMDLSKLNGLATGEAPRAEECLVFYKRGIVTEPVHLAGSPASLR